MKMILGSQSAWRKRMLGEMGYEAEVMASNIDESAIRSTDPDELALLLARAKADALIPRINEEALLLTYDSVAVWKGEIREKPGLETEARKFLQDYVEYPVDSSTAIVITNTKTGKRLEGVDTASTHFRKMSAENIDTIIADGCVYGCAGGFCVQHPLFEQWIERIEGEKESVAGLPVALTKRLLAEITA